MKKSRSLLVIAALFFIASCSNNKENDTTVTVDTTATMATDNMQNDTTGNKATTAPDPSTPNGFAMTAASGGMMEVELANLVQQKGSSKEVKDYAKMLEQDHTKANNDLKSIANGKNMTLPSVMMPEQQTNVNNLNTMSGADLDKMYISMMVDDHMKDIDMFKTASSNLSDAELKSFAGKTLPVLQKHLDKAKAIQAKMK